MTNETDSGLVELPATEAASPNAPNRVLITFANDHDISGAKFDIVNVTAEQVAVAIFHLSRIANNLANLRDMQSARNRLAFGQQVADVKRELARRNR